MAVVPIGRPTYRSPLYILSRPAVGVAVRHPEILLTLEAVGSFRSWWIAPANVNNLLWVFIYPGRCNQKVDVLG